MHFTTALSTAMLLLAGQAMANPVANVGSDMAAHPASNEIRDTADVDAAGIATDPYYACNCPNNCSHKKGSSCKYHSGPSDKSTVIKGHCAYMDQYLWCS